MSASNTSDSNSYPNKRQKNYLTSNLNSRNQSSLIQASSSSPPQTDQMNQAPSNNWQQRAITLHKKFCEYGECDEPSTSMDTMTNANLPEALQALLSVSGEWHIHLHHYGAYGCNLFKKGAFFDKMGVVGRGSDEYLADWRNDHDSPNCAEDGWECFCRISEYDFIFVCVDAGSPYYGYTRHLVDNCCEDDPFLDGPFDVFFEFLEGFADAWLEDKKTDGNFGDLCFLGYFYDTVIHSRIRGTQHSHNYT
jgi:hypothetical protein